jgi:hypothetical protein
VTDLAALNTSDLLRLYSGILDELRDRGVVRSRNAPAGDLAETLSCIVYGGHLAPQSEKSWDVRAADNRTIQVKCRVIAPGQRGAFSPFRSPSFDACVFIVLDPDYRLVSAIEIPSAQVYAVAREVTWVNGVRVTSGQNLLELPGAVDLTERFAAAMIEVARATVTHPIVTTPTNTKLRSE